MTCTKEKQLVFSYVKNEETQHYFHEAVDARKRAVHLLIEAIIADMAKQGDTFEEVTYTH